MKMALLVILQLLFFSSYANAIDGDNLSDAEVGSILAAGTLIYDSKILSSGKILVAGHFNQIGAKRVSNIVRFNADGTIDATFAASTNERVRTLEELADGSILIGGDFTKVNGIARMAIAKLSSNGTLMETFDAGIFGDHPNFRDVRIEDIEMQTDGKILIVGMFGSIQDFSRLSIARLGSTGEIDATFTPNLTDQVALVHTIEVDNEEPGLIYVGGSFNEFDDLPRAHLVMLDSAGDLVSPFNPNINGSVHKVILLHDTLIISGGFSMVNLEVKKCIARIDIAGDNVPFFPDVSDCDAGAITDFTIDNNGDLVIAGSFSTVWGEVRQGVARIDINGILDSEFVPPSDVPGYILSVDVDASNNVFIGRSDSQELTKPFLKLTSSGAKDITSGFNNAAFYLPAEVHTIAEQEDGKLLVGGDFVSYNGVVRENIVRLNTDYSIDHSFAPTFDQVISSIVVQADGNIIVGGNFNEVNGESKLALVRLDEAGEIDDSFTTQISRGSVADIAIDGSQRIVVAGLLGQTNGESIGDLVRLNPDGTSDLSFLPRASNGPYFSAFTDELDRVIVIRGSALNRYKSDGSFDPTFFFSQARGSISDMVELQSNKILISGDFERVLGVRESANLIRLKNDGAQDGEFALKLPMDVNVIREQANGMLMIGGASLADKKLVRLTKNGDIDESFLVTVNGAINAMHLAEDRVVIGGLFSEVNGQARTSLAVLELDNQPIQSHEVCFPVMTAESGTAIICL